MQTHPFSIPGIRVGHAHDSDALTGCTVILCPEGAVGGVDQRGGAPGTRETDLLRPLHRVQDVHAVLLTGGSAFGLDAAGGVMRWLEEQGIGFETGVARVPIVPAAVLYDLGLGSALVRPDAAMGYAACQAASEDPPAQGNVGAGMGASVGKILGPAAAVKAGLGTAAIVVGEGAIVAALMAVNALGDVIDPASGRILAGARRVDPDSKAASGQGPFADTLQVLSALAGSADPDLGGSENTVLGVVATNARLSKEQANKVASMAHDGLARAIRPAHTMFDGDTIFALGTGEVQADFNLVGAYAAEMVAAAIVNAVMSAEAAAGIPAARDLISDVDEAATTPD